MNTVAQFTPWQLVKLENLNEIISVLWVIGGILAAIMMVGIFILASLLWKITSQVSAVAESLQILNSREAKKNTANTQPPGTK